MFGGGSPVKKALVDENPIKKAFHWHPRGLRGRDDESAAAAEEHDEEAPLIASSPKPTLDEEDVYTPLAKRTWDVKMPPAKMHVVKGRLVPSVGGTVGALVRQKKRRISLDVLLEEGEDVATLDEDRKRKVQDLLSGDSVEPSDDEELLEGETVVYRVLKEAGGHHEHDDSSTEGDTGPDADGWIQKHMYALDGVEIQKTSHSHCDVKVGHGHDTQVRQINFHSEAEMMSFYRVFKRLVALETKRAEKRVRDFHSSVVQGSSQILLLVEIVSGMRLPIADASTSDPYVIVRLGSKEVHRTKPIYSTINPIWTISNGSLFLLSTTPETFFAAAAGLTFIVKDYDAMGKNDTLGKVVVKQDELLKGKGERKEYKLVDVRPQDRKRPGKLALRFRKATPQDVEFMERLLAIQNPQTVGMGVGMGIYSGAQKAISMGVYGEAQKDKSVGVYADETLLPPKVTSAPVLKREHKGYGDKKEVRVKPGPDPDRPAETKWMTEAQIEAECDKPSKEWVEAGSGQIGKLYVEVLGCDSLPNMDKGTIGGGKTDAFVSIVYEDCIVNTEVINDVLSPRWMPWTQRAFVFHMMHPSSQLMVGVLDFDSPAPMADHDPIGRAAINITNFHVDAEYTLYYDLYTSAIVSKHKMKGQIKLRLRIEVPERRKCLLESIKLPPQIYINVATLRDYRIAKFVMEGKYDVNKYNMDLLAGYVEELQEYQSLIPLLQQAVFTVLFWRGTFPISIRVPQCPALASGESRRLWDRVTKSVTIRLPLHSLTAFIGGILLAEDFNLLPAFILFGIAWILIASAGYLHRHPSPWHRRRSFLDSLRLIVTAGAPMQSIQPYQNEEAVKQFLAEKEEVEKKRKEEAEKKAQEEQLHEETKAEMGDAEEGGEVEMDTKVQGFGVQINPLAPILFPMQQHLEMACRYVRIARSYVTWEESFGAFWIVIASILSGLALLFIPWAFILRWLFRLAVWVVLGPWMKLVDIFYIKKPRSTEEEQKEAEARLKAKYKAFLDSSREKQTEREGRLKLKDMKRYMFGEYLLTVPRFKQARYVDFPLDASQAVPCVSDTSSDVDITCRKYGQYLSGVMIPEREMDKVPEKSSLVDARVQNYGSMD